MSFTSAGIIKGLLECFGLEVSWCALVIPGVLQGKATLGHLQLSWVSWRAWTQPLLKAISTAECHLPAGFQSTVTVPAG